MLQTVQYLESKDMPLCGACKESFRADVENHRHAIWANLPDVIGMSGWSDLIEADLPGLSAIEVQKTGGSS